MMGGSWVGVLIAAGMGVDRCHCDLMNWTDRLQGGNEVDCRDETLA